MTPVENQVHIHHPEAEHLIDDLEALKVYFDPMRSRIMRTVAYTPRTVQEIAQELDVPFTRLYYHMGLLEKHGLIRVVETRNLSGAVEEKFYQIAARSFVIDRSLLTVSSEDGDEEIDGLEIILGTMFDDAMGAIRTSIHEGKLDVNKTSPEANAMLVRNGRFRIPKDKETEFHQKFLDLMTEMATAGCDDNPDDCVDYGLMIAFFPSVAPEIPDEA